MEFFHEHFGAGSTGDDGAHGVFNRYIDRMHIFFRNVVDESGGRIGTSGNKNGDCAITVAISDKCGDHGFVLKDLYERNRGERGLLSAKELIHGLFNHFIPGCSAEETAF